MASRSVHPVLHGAPACAIERAETHHATRCVAIGRIYAASMPAWRSG